MELRVLDLDQIDFPAAQKLQSQLAAEIAAGARPPTLLLLEHPHTFTLGSQFRPEHLLWSPAELEQRGVQVFPADRGGDITYHGPGQLVGYPLLPVPGDRTAYLRKLEQVLILALMRLGLVAGQRSGQTGVWVQAEIASRCPRCLPQDRAKPAKIAALGVKVDARGISRHGFALNVDPDMSFFDGMVPCGIHEYPVVSLADLLPDPPAMRTVKAEVTRAFGMIFDYEPVLSSI